MKEGQLLRKSIQIGICFSKLERSFQKYSIFSVMQEQLIWKSGQFKFNARHLAFLIFYFFKLAQKIAKQLLYSFLQLWVSFYESSLGINLSKKKRFLRIYLFLLKSFFNIIFMISGIKAYSKLKWTPEEQELLRTLKQDKNIDSWKTIANQMNKLFVQKNRSGKQCRERYMNYVRFGNEIPKSTGWTQVEDQELFLKFMKHGAKWVQIGKQMPGRSENCLKNRFYGAMRKIIRKINKAAKEKKLRQKKPIKADLLIRILQHQIIIKQSQQNKNSEACQFLQALKQQMIKIAINSEQSSSLEQIQSLIGGIIKFCSIIKAPTAKKSCQKAQLEDFKDEIVESQECNLSNSYQKGSDQSEPEEQRTLVENKSDREGEGKHKIIRNLILVSSIDLIQDKTQTLTKSTTLEIGNSEAISWLRKFSSN